MGYYDGILSPYFKKDSDGNTVFLFGANRLLDFNGMFKSKSNYSAYVITDPELESYLRRRLKICYIFMLWGLPPLYASIMPFLIHDKIFPGILFVALIAMSISYLILYLFWLSVRSRVRYLTKTTITIYRKDNLESAAKAMGQNTIILLAIVAFTFVACGFFIMWTISETKWIGLLSILFFGPCFVIFLRMLKYTK
jgi:hypothetical protein